MSHTVVAAGARRSSGTRLAIKASSDVNDFKAYLAEYPKGKFATLAKNNLDNLGKLIGRDPVLGQLGVAYAALDKGDVNSAEAIFKELTKEKKQALLVVTHDMDFAKRSDRIVEMADGKVELIKGDVTLMR
jgi:ABC-type uncharacterized transport system ATPase subunit